MRRVVSVALALVAFGFASPVSASQPGTLVVTVTEEFAFMGCPFPADPFLVDLCGTAKSHGQGKANTTTLVTVFAPAGDCFVDVHETTLDFKRGDQLTVEVNGLLCPTGGQNFTFSGTYEVIGGTGIYAGATGSGINVGGRQDGPVISDLVGTLILQ